MIQHYGANNNNNNIIKNKMKLKEEDCLFLFVYTQPTQLAACLHPKPKLKYIYDVTLIEKLVTPPKKWRFICIFDFSSFSLSLYILVIYFVYLFWLIKRTQIANNGNGISRKKLILLQFYLSACSLLYFTFFWFESILSGPNCRSLGRISQQSSKFNFSPNKISHLFVLSLSLSFMFDVSHRRLIAIQFYFWSVRCQSQ